MYKFLNFWVFNCLVFCAITIYTKPAEAQKNQHSALKAASIFSNNMVLQRNVKTPIWGWATPNSMVNIQLNTNHTSTITNTEGKWMAYLPALKAGGPHNIKIYQTKDTLTISNVLIGDVWLASGQSNMGWQLDWGVDNKDEEIKNSTNSNIRFFTVADDLNNKPQQDVSGGEWVESNPQTSPKFSALAYFFAKDLQKELNIPIGIIHSSWGGTRIETWMSAEMLKTHPEYANSITAQMGDTTNFENGYEDFNKQNVIRDSIIKISDVGIRQKVFAVNYNDSKWQTILLPAKLTSVGVNNFYGYCWFRKSIVIPEKDIKKDLILNFGEITSENICYLNGQELKRLNQNPMVQYIVPYGILKPNHNQITMRILARWGVGGFDSKIQLLFAQSSDKDFKIPLSGFWKYNYNIEPQTPLWTEPYNTPTYIYNAKIAPLFPYAIKGIIWYQGESNNDKSALLYKSLFPLLISNWRTQFNQPNLPFIYGQLANYGTKVNQPEESKTAVVRNAQLQTLNVPNTAMVVNIDLGTDGDVHFKNKKESGSRFALAALDIAYQHDNSFINPVFKIAKTEGNTIRLFFSKNTLGFKTKNGQALKGFAISAANGKFVWAKAKIEGKQIVVWANQIKKPVFVRYAWGNNPDCNLLNLAGLPVSPFKTDNKLQ